MNASTCRIGPKGLLLPVCIAAALLQGCVHTMSVPEPTLPAEYRSADRAEAPIEYQNWWDSLGDPALSTLIVEAMRGNPDLEAAGARIAAARARLGIARSQSAPQIESVTRANRQKLSENGLLHSGANGGAFPNTYTLESTGLDASWELDLFGAHAAERRKASAGYSEAIAEREAVRLSLAAEIARVYVEHSAYAQQLASARQVVAMSEQTLELIEQQYEEGQAAEADVTSARVAVQAASERVPGLVAEVEARRHVMGVLVGSGEYVDLPERTPLFGDDLAPARAGLSIDMGVPSDLLRRRPDIRRAEARFEAAVADRSIAVADQYPRFSIVASVGNESIEHGSLLESASQFWLLAPQVTMPFFDGGRRKSVVAEREALVTAATADYRKAVIEALSDVEQALIRHHGATGTMEARLVAIEQARDVLAHEETRYELGASARPELLAARSDFEAHRQSLLDAKKDALLSLIALYKSLGGDTEEVSS